MDNYNNFIKYKNFCNNCGKHGHIYSKCKEPVISMGIINFKCDIVNSDIENIIRIFNSKYENKKSLNIVIPLHNKIICPTEDVMKKTQYLEKFEIFNNSIKFLMIQRKNSLGYIEFIRGRYDVDNPNSIIYLFQQMIADEIKMIEEYDIDHLWGNLWSSSNIADNIKKEDSESKPSKNKYRNKIYENEFKKSREKFNLLKNGGLEYDLYFYTKNVTPNFLTPEWGFPKGRRNQNECNLECAVREFNEECGYDCSDYKILKRLHTLSETFRGTNGIRYKHIYYIAMNDSDKELMINKNNIEQAGEIGNIGWFTYHEALRLIRPHHKQRKKMLSQLYMFILNKLINIDLTCGSNNSAVNNSYR